MVVKTIKMVNVYLALGRIQITPEMLLGISEVLRNSSKNEFFSWLYQELNKYLSVVYRLILTAPSTRLD